MFAEEESIPPKYDGDEYWKKDTLLDCFNNHYNFSLWCKDKYLQ